MHHNPPGANKFQFTLLTAQAAFPCKERIEIMAQMVDLHIVLGKWKSRGTNLP
jgi:hypothetical protein